MIKTHWIRSTYNFGIISYSVIVAAGSRIAVPSLWRPAARTTKYRQDKWETMKHYLGSYFNAAFKFFQLTSFQACEPGEQATDSHFSTLVQLLHYVRPILDQTRKIEVPSSKRWRCCWRTWDSAARGAEGGESSSGSGAGRGSSISTSAGGKSAAPFSNGGGKSRQYLLVLFLLEEKLAVVLELKSMETGFYSTSHSGVLISIFSFNQGISSFIPKSFIEPMLAGDNSSKSLKCSTGTIRNPQSNALGGMELRCSIGRTRCTISETKLSGAQDLEENPHPLQLQQRPSKHTRDPPWKRTMMGHFSGKWI
ncbi:hypothetical protein C8J56DRAFT_1027965 [Mycena floridula]|nr:hypothetical protein C8J56DRAFT_1027965 [Mycena floridula]